MLILSLLDIDPETLAITDHDTGEVFDAVAVIPTHAPDLAKLVNMLSPAEARNLARMAAARAKGVQLLPEAA